MKLSIALPCYNEEGNIEATVADLEQWLDSAGVEGEIIAVNDGSSDGTAELLQSLARSHPRLRVLTHERNLGYGAAVRSGLDAGTGEWLAFMDSDGQFRAEDLAHLMSAAAGTDVVTGRRRVRADPFVRRLNARCFRLANRLLFGVWVDDVNCAMKMIRRQVWQRIRPRVTTGALFNIETFARMAAQGIQWRQVDVEHYPRRAGVQTGAKPMVILRAAWEMLLLRYELWAQLPPAARAAPRRS